MRPQAHDIEAVIRQALDKYEKGRLELGQLDLSTDSRNFIDEAIRDSSGGTKTEPPETLPTYSALGEEMLDAINYLTFQIIRLRNVR